MFTIDTYSARVLPGMDGGAAEALLGPSFGRAGRGDLCGHRRVRMQIEDLEQEISEYEYLKEGRLRHVAPTTCLHYGTSVDILTEVLNAEVALREVMRGR